MDIDILNKLSAKFDTLATFTAKNRVMSDAIGTFKDKLLCEAGDKIQVIKWYCQNGPTEILITDQNWQIPKKRCIPFGWVMEMGAPKELSMYMPFPEKTWAEIIKEN